MDIQSSNPAPGHHRRLKNQKDDDGNTQPSAQGSMPIGNIVVDLSTSNNNDAVVIDLSKYD